MENNPFFNAFTKKAMGIKGLGSSVHLSHVPGSDEFHITTSVQIEDLGTVKVRNFFDSKGNFKRAETGFTDKE